jgi:flagellar basal-body rod protein FlgC
MRPMKRGFLLCLCLLLMGCENDRSREPEAVIAPNASVAVQTFPFMLPVRRCPDVVMPAPVGDREMRRADETVVQSSHLDGDIQLVVHLGSMQSLNNSAWLTEKLGFVPATGTGWLLRRRVAAREKAVLAKELETLLVLAGKEVRESQDRLASVGEPGLLSGRVTEAGQLIYTGHPLDLAMPDTARGSLLFLPVLTSDGQRTYTRGGRLYVDDLGRLALREGPLAEQIVVSAEARALRVKPTGEVEAVLSSGNPKLLGRLALVPLGEPAGNGRTFSGVVGAPVLAGENGVPLLKPGHLEYPHLNVKSEVTRLAERERDVRILRRIELGLAEPFRQTMVNPPMQPVQPVERSPDLLSGFPLQIGADLPLAVPHLKVLGVQVEAAPGRVLVLTGDRDETRRQTVAALTKVLQGLRKRMDITHLNYRNANRLRDEQGQLNPYRRKLIRVGPEGELLEAEDETPFRKEFNPNHPDVGLDGSVLFPNVNRLVEKADFEQAATEYRLIRTALERLAPGIIFPDPPVLQVEAKAP